MNGPGRRTFWPYGLAFVFVIVATPFTAHAYDNHGVSPDLVAWEVFTEAVAPSNGPGARELEFETWATDDDLFRVSPPRWPTGEQPSRAECKRTFDKEAAKAAGFPDDGCIKRVFGAIGRRSDISSPMTLRRRRATPVRFATVVKSTRRRY